MKPSYTKKHPSAKRGHNNKSNHVRILKDLKTGEVMRNFSEGPTIFEVVVGYIFHIIQGVVNLIPHPIITVKK